MLHYQLNKKLFNEPIRLSEDEKKNPILVIADFFENYNLSEVRQINQQMDHVCLSTDTPPYDDPDERAGLLLYRENEEKVMEAAYLLFQRNQSIPRNSQPQDPETGENPPPSIEHGEIPSSQKSPFAPPTGLRPKLDELIRGLYDAQVEVAVLCVKLHPVWAQSFRAEIKQSMPPYQQKHSNEQPKEQLDMNELNLKVIILQGNLTRLGLIALELSDMSVPE